MAAVGRCGMRLVFLVLAVLLGAAPGAASEPVRVVLLVVDGLGAERATAEHLPRLHGFVADWRGSWGRAQAVLPARTNPNHASLLTGVHPDVHGIVGNKYWDAETGGLRSTERPELLEMETLFTSIAAERPDRRTAAFLSKAKLRRLFSAVPGRQAAADLAWSPSQGDLTDVRVLAAAERLLVAEPADLAVITIAEVDRTSHQFGPEAPEAWAAVARVDELLEGLLRRWAAEPMWRRTVVMITADHGFTTVTPATSVLLVPAAGTRGRSYVAEGGLAFVHLRPSAGAVGEVAADEALRPGLAAVVRDLGRVHLAHPRAGSLVLLAEPGRAFVQAADDPSLRFRGNHGGVENQDVPLIVVGGLAGLRPLPEEATFSVVDVAPTVAALLGVRRPARLDGKPLPPASAGQILPLLPHPNP